MIRKIAVILLINIVFLSGCAYLRKPPSTFKYISWRKRQLIQRQIKNWDMRGVFSITYERKRDIARFAWKQRRDNYTINISGPMNMNRVSLMGGKDRVRFWQADGEFVEANTPEQLVYEQLGWQLPISDIRYWILGMPAPKKVDYKYFDRYGHINFFKQSGWQVKYSEFQCGVKRDLDLPKTIELKSEEVAIKIKIKEQYL